MGEKLTVALDWSPRRTARNHPTRQSHLTRSTHGYARCRALDFEFYADADGRVELRFAPVGYDPVVVWSGKSIDGTVDGAPALPAAAGTPS